MLYFMYSGTYKELKVAVKRMDKTLSKEDKILLKDVGKHDNIVIYYHIVRLLLKQYNICCCIIFRKQIVSMIILHLSFV